MPDDAGVYFPGNDAGSPWNQAEKQGAAGGRIAGGFALAVVVAPELAPMAVRVGVGTALIDHPVATAIAIGVVEGAAGVPAGSPNLGGFPSSSITVKGPRATTVYIGYSTQQATKGTPCYVGIAYNWLTRSGQHAADKRTFNILPLVTPPSRAIARGVEQIIIDLNPAFQNRMNSISPTKNPQLFNQMVADGWRFIQQNKVPLP